MTSLDELMTRMDDDSQTFTASEVRTIVEHVERRALDDIYNKTRIAQRAANDAQMAERVNDALERLVASKEPEKVVTLKVVTFDGS